MGELENLDFHDFWLLGICRNPYLWIWIYQKYFKNIENEHVLKHITFVNLRIWSVDWFGNCMRHFVWNLECFNLKILDFGHFEMLIFRFLMLWTNWKIENGNVKTWKLENMENGTQDIWNLENWILETWKFQDSEISKLIHMAT